MPEKLVCLHHQKIWPWKDCIPFFPWFHWFIPSFHLLWFWSSYYVLTNILNFSLISPDWIQEKLVWALCWNHEYLSQEHSLNNRSKSYLLFLCTSPLCYLLSTFHVMYFYFLFIFVLYVLFYMSFPFCFLLVLFCFNTSVFSAILWLPEYIEFSY